MTCESRPATPTFQDHLAETSLPGAAYIGRPARYTVLSRIVWLLIINSLIIITGVMIYKRLKFFNTQPTNSEVSWATQSILSFPAVIVCHLNPLRTSALVEHNLLTNLTSPDVESSLSDKLLLSDIIHDLAHQPNVTIHSCRFGNDDCRHEVESVLTDMGVCAAINLDGKMQLNRYNVDMGLQLTINMESHEFFDTAQFTLDKNLKKSPTFGQKYKGRSVQVYVGWHADLPLHQMRQAGDRIDANEAVTLVHEIKEYKNLDCSDEERVRTLPEYAPFNTSYTRRKCEQLDIMNAVWKACGQQHWYQPYVSREAAANNTFKDYLLHPTYELHRNYSDQCDKEVARLIDPLINTCDVECYLMTFPRSSFLINTLTVPPMPTASADPLDWLEGKQNCSAADEVSATKALLEALKQALVGTNTNYAAIESRKEKIKTDFWKIFRNLDELYAGSGIVPIYKRKDELVLQMASSKNLNDPLKVAQAENNNSFTNVWLSSCQLPTKKTIAAARPVEVVYELEQLWRNVREYLTSKNTWRKLHVMRKHQWPFDSSSAMNFSAVDAWFANLSEPLQHAVRAQRYPITRKFNWGFDFDAHNITEQMVGEADEALHKNVSATIDGANYEHEFWYTFEVLRWLASNCTDRNCQQRYANALLALYEDIAGEQEFEELRNALKDDPNLDIFSENSEMWHTQDFAAVTLLPSDEWQRTFEFMSHFTTKPEYSFSKTAHFMDDSWTTVSQQLSADANKFAKLIDDFRVKTVDRNLLRIFGMGPPELKQPEDRWVPTVPALVNDYITRFLRATDPYANAHVFDEAMAKAIDSCIHNVWDDELSAKKESLRNLLEEINDDMKTFWDTWFESSRKLVFTPDYNKWYTENFAEIKVRFVSAVLETTTKQSAYDFWALVSDLGGIVGLTLGSSFVTIMELLFVVLTTVMAVGGVANLRERRNQRAVNSVNQVVDAKTPP